MKRIHLILILAFLAIAAMLRWQNIRIQNRESELRQELAAVEPPATALSTRPPVESGMSASPGRVGSRPRSQVANLPPPPPEGFENWSIADPDVSKETLEAYSSMKNAIANGDMAEAIRYFTLLPKRSKDPSWADRLVSNANTPELQRIVLDQAAISADPQTFTLLAQSIAKYSTFEANLDLLSRAELTPEKYDIAAAAIAGAKIDEDTSARVEWLLKSLRTNQTEPITQFSKSWTEGDFRAATTWVNTLPPGRNRDAAVVGFAPVAARLDGASAVDWALTITDPAQRQATLDAVSQTWKSREPAAAAAYLTEKGIEIKPQ